MADIIDEKEFEERSDYIEDSDLELWNVENNHFNHIQQKLLTTGIKLLSGPRGTGKTHQMKITHLMCTKDVNKPLSVFVSFSKYYYLEPFLTKVPNAIQIFHTWMLSKIIVSCFSVVEDQSEEYEIFKEPNEYLNKAYISSFIEKAEKLRANQLNDDPLISLLSIPKVTAIIEDLALFFKRKRAILMLDDAALSLTPEYLVEFFDVVRSLKTRTLSPKVSVYPGTTQYGPRFHVGQDAEIVQCWLSVEDTTYSAFMNSLIEKRFSQYTEGVNADVIDLFKYASFGVPRAFISLLRSYRTNIKKNPLQNFNTVIAQQAKFIESEYLSIAQKLGQYKRVIESGNKLFNRITEEIRKHNITLVNEKNITIGISNESIQNYKLSDRMIRFLIEAGLLYEDTSVKFGSQSTGEKREYKRLVPHILFLIQNRSFSQTPTVNFSEMLSRIRLKSSRHPLRRVITSLLTTSELNGLTLDLPPCQNCNTMRLSIEQRFCHNCGQELINKSLFEKCLEISVDDIPISAWLKKKMKDDGLKTVNDFISLQDPGTRLKEISRIGSARSKHIYEEVMKTVDDFLE